MNASDIIRKIQSQAIYSYSQINLATTQPNCALGNCTSSPSTCILQFNSFADKNLFYTGKYYCSSCTNNVYPNTS